MISNEIITTEELEEQENNIIKITVNNYDKKNRLFDRKKFYEIDIL